MLYTCPKCNQPFDLDPKEVNETHSVTCPHCQAHFDFGAPVPKEEPHEEPVLQNATVPPLPDFKLCPFCGEEIRAAALKCKHCGELLTPDNPLYAKLKIQPPTNVSAPQQVEVPAPAPAPEPEVGPSVIPTPFPEAAPLPVEAPVFSPQPEELPQPEEPKKDGSGAGGWIALILGIVVLIVIVFIATPNSCGGENKQSAPEDDYAHSDSVPYVWENGIADDGEIVEIGGGYYMYDASTQRWYVYGSPDKKPRDGQDAYIEEEYYLYDADMEAWILAADAVVEEAPAE